MFGLMAGDTVQRVVAASTHAAHAAHVAQAAEVLCSAAANCQEGVFLICEVL